MNNLIKQILLLTMLTVFTLISTVSVYADSTVDDAAIFVEAFDAFQAKDYLLTIEKINRLHSIFPDTPLRDVSLLLLARANLKSGDNEAAGKTLNIFHNEFSSSPLTASIEEELASMGSKVAKGEKPKQNKQLKQAAQKLRNEKIAIERAAELKKEQERLAREKVERERIAREKSDAEKKERERIALEKADKESIKTAILIPESKQTAIAGNIATALFTIENRGTKNETFSIDSPSSDFGARFHPDREAKNDITNISIAAGKSFSGAVSFKLPSQNVDGQTSKIPIRITSTRHKDITNTREIPVTTSAPLLRVVARPSSTSLSPGAHGSYKITVLNIGSRAAKDLDATMILPTKLEFVEASGAKFLQESSLRVSFTIPTLESGKVTEFILKFKARTDVLPESGLKGELELLDGASGQKSRFMTTPISITKN